MLEHLPRATREAINQHYAERMHEIDLRAQAESAAIGRMNQEDHRALDGVGELTYRIHPTHRAMLNALGMNWQDPDVRKWFVNKAMGAYARVRSGGTRIQVGYTGVPRNVRFHRNFGKL